MKSTILNPDGSTAPDEVRTMRKKNDKESTDMKRVVAIVTVLVTICAVVVLLTVFF